MDSRVEALAAATVLDVEGVAHRFGDYLRDKPAVVLFVRHFG